MPPLNLNAKVVVPCASLIFACGFCDMEFVYVDRNAAGYDGGVSMRESGEEQRNLRLALEGSASP